MATTWDMHDVYAESSSQNKGTYLQSTCESYFIEYVLNSMQSLCMEQTIY